MRTLCPRVGTTGRVRLVDRFNQAAFQLAGMTGSIKHAARLLSISPVAVNTRVRSLERELGVRLFERQNEEDGGGTTYLGEVEATFVSFDMATRDLRTRFGQPAHFIRLLDAPRKETDSDLRFDSGQRPPQSADRDHLDRLFDEALAATSPASDPVAICSRSRSSQVHVAKA
jgi:molybdenum-dependent DNA-binding transcriptional regulator ModE